MPPWGRPPRGRAGVGRFMEGGAGAVAAEVDDVLRFQELDSEEERVLQHEQHEQHEQHGVWLNGDFSQNSSGKHFNPDELYFNDMDLQAWERRTSGEQDGLAYGDYGDDYYGYGEDELDVDEGFYDDAQGPNLNISPEEYQELLFQRALDKIRVARATGKQDVSLTPEELQAYENKLLGRPPAPAARPPAVSQIHPSSSSSGPAVRGITNGSPYGTLSAAGPVPAPIIASGSGPTPSTVATRPKRSRRSSLFGILSKPSDKSSSRKRAPSVTSDTANLRASLQAALQPPPHPPPQPPNTATFPPPGFLVPGSNNQPIYNPINSFNPRLARESQAQTLRRNSSPFRPPGSRSASLNSNNRYSTTPPRISPPRDMSMPGGFPSNSPQRAAAPGLESATPPRRNSRPVSSSSHYSIPDDGADPQFQPRNRSRSGSIQQRSADPPAMISFPITGYPYSTEPYAYASIPATAQAQPQRRVVSGPGGPPAESGYMAVPRRVPVPQRPVAGVLSSYSDPVVPGSARGPAVEAPDEPGGGVLVDVVPTGDGGYRVRSSAGTSAEKGGSPGGTERRRRSGRTVRRR